MKTVIISDLHLGDPKCSLVANSFAKAKTLVDSIGGTCDYLVLEGDIFDIAVSDYNTVFSLAKDFFAAMTQAGLHIGTSIVYSPGNHDFDLWDTFQRQINILGQINPSEQATRPFQWSIPGVFHEETSEFRLPTIDNDPSEYNIPFLHNLAGTRVCFAYPNLYYVRTNGTTDLITHGHYLGATWSELGKMCAGINNPAMQIANPNNLTLEEVVQLNFPLNQLTSTGVGQAGKFTSYVRWCMLQESTGNLPALKSDVEKLVQNYLSDKGSWFFKLIRPIAKSILVNLFMDEITGSENPTTMEAYVASNQTRINNFIGSTVQEMTNLDWVKTARIQHLVSGHTHLPVSPAQPIAITTPYGSFSASNMGGWIEGEHGAEVHIYETGKPLRSVFVK